MTCMMGCAKDYDNFDKVIFMGDSHIANFDTEYFFPLWKTENLGISGLKIDQLAEQITKFDFSNNDVLVIQIGTNDILTWPEKNTEKFIFDFKKKLEVLFTILDEKKCHVKFTGIICPESYISFNLDRNIYQLTNELVKDLTLSKTNFIYISTTLLNNNEGKLKRENSTDGIHLNHNGYAIFANEI